jgi:hypothetical protein
LREQDFANLAYWTSLTDSCYWKLGKSCFSKKLISKARAYFKRGDRRRVNHTLKIRPKNPTAGEHLKMKSQRELIKEGKTSFCGGIYNHYRNQTQGEGKGAK